MPWVYVPDPWHEGVGQGFTAKLHSVSVVCGVESDDYIGVRRILLGDSESRNISPSLANEITQHKGGSDKTIDVKSVFQVFLIFIKKAFFNVFYFWNAFYFIVGSF